MKEPQSLIYDTNFAFEIELANIIVTQLLIKGSGRQFCKFWDKLKLYITGLDVDEPVGYPRK